MAIDAIYFDGEFARDNAVKLDQMDGKLVFTGPDVPLTSWSISGLHPIDAPATGQPFRITHDSKPGARLVIRDMDFVQSLVAQNKHLQGGYSWSHLRQVAVWTVGGIIVAAVLGYVLVSLLPQKVAQILPDKWRSKVGEQVVTSLVGAAKRCTSNEGDAAKSAMIEALAQGNPDLPPLSMEIYDMEMVNAFAAPGGKIIFTRGILEKADTPDEIAGVLAHEIGHVAHLHPETQLVRLTGLQVLISVLSGTNGGDFTSNVAALAALLRYSREAEREADSYARKTMEQANIDPMGLRRFFEKIMVLEGGSSGSNTETSALDRIGNVFSSHPGTEERIKDIQPLPAGSTAVPALSAEQWTALKAICG